MTGKRSDPLPTDPRVFMRYKVVRCPRCDRLQAVRAVKTFRCMFCGHRRPMREMRIYYATDDPRKVVETVKAMKEDRFSHKPG